jgi:transcriptional regulator with XRE-family HTH domain
MEMSRLGFSERLMHFRKKKSMTQKEVALALDISNKTVSHWETGRTAPDAETLKKIAQLYGVDVEAIEGDKDTLDADIKRASSSVELNAAPPILALISATVHLTNLVNTLAPAESPLGDAAGLVEKALGRVHDALPPQEREQATRLIQGVARRYGAGGQGAEGRV